VISSVGLEHYLDRVGVTGSNPVSLTTNLTFEVGFFFAYSEAVLAEEI